jgi:hypothetical protein
MLVGIQREFTTFNLPPTLSLILVNAGFNLAFAVWIVEFIHRCHTVRVSRVIPDTPPNPNLRDRRCSGRYWARTSDLLLVRQALYQLS